MLQTGASGILRGRCAGAQEPGAGSELCQRGAVGSGGSQHGQGSPPSPWKEAVAGGEQQVLEVSVPASLQKKGEGEKRSSPGAWEGQDAAARPLGGILPAALPSAQGWGQGEPLEAPL